MKKYFCLFVCVILGITCFSQNGTIEQDPSAKIILDQVFAKIKKNRTMQVKISGIETLESTKSSESFKGFYYFKNNSYKYTTKDLEITDDSKSQWVYFPNESEVSITKSESNEIFALNPNNLFTLYEKLNYELPNEYTKNGKKFVSIKLISRTSSIKVIYLHINKLTSEIVSVKILFNGVSIIINIDEIKTDVEIDDNMFIFDKTKYPVGTNFNIETD